MFFDESNLIYLFIVDAYLVIIYLCQSVFNSGDWLFRVFLYRYIR